MVVSLQVCYVVVLGRSYSSNVHFFMTPRAKFPGIPSTGSGSTKLAADAFFAKAFAFSLPTMPLYPCTQIMVSLTRVARLNKTNSGST